MYSEEEAWRELQALLPSRNQITDDSKPLENYKTINGMEIHIDEYERDALISVVVLHGVGGNGRLLSFLAVPLARAGYNVLCPDLPGYGYSRSQKRVTYADWIDVGSKIAGEELAKGRKVFLVGLSAGGMLAYNVACRHQDVSGLIVTNLLDNRDEEVRIYSAKNKFQAKYGIRFVGLLPSFLRSLKVPIKMVTNMQALVNNNEVLKVLLKDQRGAGSRVNLDFLCSMMNSIPMLEPEQFKRPPVLMVHPGNDRWTPLQISERFFVKIAAPKRIVVLEKGGHFPVEEEALIQMEEAILNFIKEEGMAG